jgi:hypothetical protein
MIVEAREEFLVNSGSGVALSGVAGEKTLIKRM